VVLVLVVVASAAFAAESAAHPGTRPAPEAGLQVGFVLPTFADPAPSAKPSGSPVGPPAIVSIGPRPSVDAEDSSQHAPHWPSPDASGASTCAPVPEGIVPTPVVFHGPRTQKVVALTFDDGWEADNVKRILGILTRNHVNATFFPIGQAVKRAPDVWKAVVAAGFPLGNHTFDHPDLTGLCYAAQVADLTHWATVIHDELGVTPLPLMRPPYGAYDATTPLAAFGAGLQDVVLWDVDTRDWTGLGRRAIQAGALAGRPGSIVLMHTSVDSTVAALPAIIRGYRARGFTFVTVGQLLGIDGPVPYP
jgi:peptidoglycan/xylan/chitin deacetylase (PgdA/CDA1 family)